MLRYVARAHNNNRLSPSCLSSIVQAINAINHFLYQTNRLTSTTFSNGVVAQRSAYYDETICGCVFVCSSLCFCVCVFFSLISLNCRPFHWLHACTINKRKLHTNQSCAYSVSGAQAKWLQFLFSFARHAFRCWNWKLKCGDRMATSLSLCLSITLWCSGCHSFFFLSLAFVSFHSNNMWNFTSLRSTLTFLHRSDITFQLDLLHSTYSHFHMTFLTFFDKISYHIGFILIAVRDTEKERKYRFEQFEWFSVS